MTAELSTPTVLALLELGLEAQWELEDFADAQDFSDAAEIPSESRSVGGYELVRPIASGGMGVVWQARSPRGRLVALKLMHASLVQPDRESAHFLRTAELAAELQHEHIVRVLHVGVERGHPFVVMDLVDGSPISRAGLQVSDERVGLLRALVALAGASVPEVQRNLARAMCKVASAVNYAHSKDVLHRDIKPSNILIDQRGEPRLVDFGLAGRLNRKDSSVLDGAVRGSLDYMSPEQARGGVESLTARADIYSLGATLYELLTGHVPFVAPTTAEQLEKIKGPTPVTPPRERCAQVHPHLEAVCLKCLDKDPSRRYASASELADDLRAISEDRPPAIAPLALPRRLLFWARRHPRATARIARLAVGVCLLLGLVLLLWQSQVRRTREQLLNNAAIASGQAGAVLFQLRTLGDRVHRAAGLPSSIAHARAAALTEAPGAEMMEAATDFESVFIVNTAGYMRAQWPLPPVDLRLRNYDFRDYFRGAAKLAAHGSRVVYVARAFRSERDNEVKFGVSTPIFDGNEWVGVYVGIISTDSVFGKVRLPKDPERTTALIGPRDVERNESPPPYTRFVYLVHERLAQGQEVAAPLTGALRDLDRTRDDLEPFQLVYDGSATFTAFSDPLYEAGNNWTAAFAPVGATGYVIVAQSRTPRFWDWVVEW